MRNDYVWPPGKNQLDICLALGQVFESGEVIFVIPRSHGESGSGWCCWVQRQEVVETPCSYSSRSRSLLVASVRVSSHVHQPSQPGSAFVFDHTFVFSDWCDMISVAETFTRPQTPTDSLVVNPLGHKSQQTEED